MMTDQSTQAQPLPPMEQLQSGIAAVGSQLTEFEQQAQVLIRQRPVVAVLGAAVVGYLVARLVSRGRR